MKKLYIIIVVLLIALPTQLWAEGVETMSLYGVVRDAATDAPVPWATVVIKDTTTGTTTNAEGVYEIRAKEGDVLVINCLGYEVRRVTVAKNNHINIKLKQDAIQMDEIVAVGYGKMRKSDLTGATSRVTEADFAQQSTPTDMASMLEGRMAGVNISAGEGGPNPSYSIQIRGASSVGASTQPLYVVDGFPIETSSLSEPSDGFNTTDSSPLSNIDPSNIESIEVLKDASATAIYGSRGANGVVLITTKSGKTGRAVVTYSAQVGISQVTKTVDLLDSEGFAEFMWHRSFTESDPYTAEKEAIASGDTRDYYNYKTYADSTNTDWQKEIYRTAISQSHNLSVSGGTEKSRYYVGAGYLKNEGVIQNNDFTRYSFNAKVNSELKKWLTADFNTTFGYTQSNGVATGVGGNTSSTGVIMQTLRCSPLKSPSDNIDWTMIDSESDDDVAEASTPLTFVNDVTNKKNSTRILANLALTAKLLPGLTFKNSIGTNHNLMNFESFYPSTTSKGSKSNGIASRTYQDQRSWVYEGVFNYNKSFSPKSRLGATAAFTAEENYTSEFSATNENYLYQGLGVDNMSMGTDPSDPSTSKSKSSLSSVLGRVNYTHNNKYLMTISGRADGSSRFPTGNKWAMFPSAALAWRASEEDFLKSIKQISNVKVRASYGVTGNQAIDNYATIATLGTNNYIFNNTVTSGLSLSKISNSDLRWESTRQFDAGVDIGLFGNRLNIVVDYYYKQTDDMLMDVEVPASTGYDEYIMNYGSMENKGWEVSLDAQIIKKRNFTWRMGYNMAFNRNKVLSIGGGDYIDNGYSRIIVGKSIGQFYGYKQVGIIENQEQLDLYRGVGSFGSLMKIGQRKLADINSSSNIYNSDGSLSKIVIDSDDMTIIGSYEPKFTGGMSQTFTYKAFTLDMQFKFQWGGDIYNANAASLITYDKNYNNRLAKSLDYWDAETNPNSMTPHPSCEDLSKYLDQFIEDASFIKLSSITLAYELNKKALSKLGISGCRLFVRGNNLLTITNYSGTDPEADMGTSMAPGYDYGGQPYTSSISLGVNLTF